MQFEANQLLSGFCIEAIEPLAEIDGEAIRMKHEKSGARLLFLKNDDNNKAFSITFKTPPQDNTGVFHILEHSVLCGSKKYPVKEPFVNLLKTSMQTFLNAMTFPDKTMYPVASTNEKDLMNLISVYMDAVLYPNIYEQKNIFEQEGWHYELDVPDSDDGSAEALRYNGVVFNEMKGALSSAESVLYHEMNKALFPDTCYAFESGGHPRNIPDLTYESFLDHHARHYRLDNAYIVLYGNLDAEKLLGFLDREYLSTHEARTQAGINSIGVQAPCICEEKSVSMDTAPRNACVGTGYVLGDAHDAKRVMATEILLDAVLGGNESPIKRAILDARIGGAVSAYVIDSQQQPAAMVVLRNANPGVAKQLRTIVETKAKELVEQGIPRDILEASFAQAAFALRERDRGMADGVVLAMSVMAGWLYNEEDSLAYVRYEEELAQLRAGIEAGYFEDLLKEVFVDNNHKALVSIDPQTHEGESEEEQKLASMLARLSDVDKQEISQNVERLRAIQEAPDKKEDIEKLPRLHISDIGDSVQDPTPDMYGDAPVECLHFDLETRGIDYVTHYFDIGCITWEDMPYVSILRMCLGNLGTSKLSAAEVDVLLHTYLGRFSPSLRAYTNFKDRNHVAYKFAISASAIQENVEHLATIPATIWADTQFDDKEKIRDILLQKKVGLSNSFASAGHFHAMARVAAQFDKSARLGSQQDGIDFYLFLVDLLEHFDERFDELQAKLNEVRAKIFVKDGVLTSFVGSAKDIGAFWHHAQDMHLQAGSERDEAYVLNIPDCEPVDEAYIVPTDVVYVAKGALVNLKHEPRNNSGTAAVLNSALTLDYLWNEVRVKGGAYGTGFSRNAQGFATFYSYRDPHIDETLVRFDATRAWLQANKISEEDIEGYVVSAVAKMDAPVKPQACAARSTRRFITQTPESEHERIRTEALSTTYDALQHYMEDLQKVEREGAVAVFGNKEIIEASTHEFKVVELP